MEKWVKWGLGLGIGGLLVDMTINASRLARFSKEFQLATSVRVQDITFQSVTLAIDIVFKNPTDASLTLKHPTVYLYDRDPLATKTLPTPIQTSTIQSFTYQIKPNSETKINPILITLSFLNSVFLGAVWTIVKDVIAKKPVTIWVRALSQVNGTIPISQVQSFTFNQKK